MSNLVNLKWCSVSLVVVLCRVASADVATLRIGVNADFSNAEMRIVNVVANGPATRIRSEQVNTAALEPGDVIRTVNGNQIRSHADFIAAVNDSLDGRLSIGVVDVNTGQLIQWHVSATPTATTKYEMARDTYRRAIRSDSIAHPKVYLTVEGEIVASGLAIALPSIGDGVPLRKRSDELMRELIVAVQAIYEQQLKEPTRVFSDRDFQNIDRIIEPYYQRISTSGDEAYKLAQATAACNGVSRAFDRALATWADANNKQVKNIYAAPYLPPFRVKASQPGAQVELLTVADMVLTLLSAGKSPAELDGQALNLLGNSPMWRRLKSDEASAYGSFYYRFVSFDGGIAAISPFAQERKIEITTVPDSGEIFFQ
jgi:hypothetical protein